MKVAKRDILYNEHSRFNKPSIYVMPGEEFVAETELNSGDWLGTKNDKWDISKTKALNPCVCIGVSGAKAGSMLAINILDIEPDKTGYTGFDGRNQILPYLIHQRQWETVTKTVAIESGFIKWDNKITIPVKPMIGTIGTAPEFEVLSNAKAGSHGGNMDVCEVCAGSTLYLPVYVDDALLHIGDVHAIQGDGEINQAGGIECRAELRLRVDIKSKPKNMKWVRLENDDYIMTVACCRSVEESFYAAAKEMMLWMVEEYGFPSEEAYLLMGQLLEARATQFVNPTRSYICKMPKKFLKGF